MGAHSAGGASAPSQVVHPWRATLRTVLQVGVPAVLVLVVVLPEVLTVLVEELGAQLPAGVTAFLVAAAAFITALAGALARIAAIPRVNAWLGRFRLDAGSGK